MNRAQRFAAEEVSVFVEHGGFDDVFVQIDRGKWHTGLTLMESRPGSLGAKARTTPARPEPGRKGWGRRQGRNGTYLYERWSPEETSMDYQGRDVWVMLETYDRTTDELAREMRIDRLVSIDHLLRIVGASSLDDLVLGGWRVEGAAARPLEVDLGSPIDDVKLENFVAAIQPADQDGSRSG